MATEKGHQLEKETIVASGDRESYQKSGLLRLEHVVSDSYLLARVVDQAKASARVEFLLADPELDHDTGHAGVDRLLETTKFCFEFFEDGKCGEGARVYCLLISPAMGTQTQGIPDGAKGTCLRY